MIPNFFYEIIKKQYNKDIIERILNGYNCQRKVTLRVNTIKSNKNEIENILKNNNIEFSSVSLNENALIIENVKEDKIRELDIYIEGKIYLQSLSSMLPPIILEPLSTENILDMTAAPGGKTSQIAAMCYNKGMITACEKNKIRMDRLKYNLEKQGVRMCKLYVRRC